MNYLTLQQLAQAWHFPLPNEDADRDFENRLASVQDAITQANGDMLGFYSLCRLLYPTYGRARGSKP